MDMHKPYLPTQKLEILRSSQKKPNAEKKTYQTQHSAQLYGIEKKIKLNLIYVI